MARLPAALLCVLVVGPAAELPEFEDGTHFVQVSSYGRATPVDSKRHKMLGELLAAASLAQQDVKRRESHIAKQGSNVEHSRCPCSEEERIVEITWNSQHASSGARPCGCGEVQEATNKVLDDHLRDLRAETAREFAAHEIAHNHTVTALTAASAWQREELDNRTELAVEIAKRQTAKRALKSEKASLEKVAKQAAERGALEAQRGYAEQEATLAAREIAQAVRDEELRRAQRSIGKASMSAMAGVASSTAEFQKAAIKAAEAAYEAKWAKNRSDNMTMHALMARANASASATLAEQMQSRANELQQRAEESEEEARRAEEEARRDEEDWREAEREYGSTNSSSGLNTTALEARLVETVEQVLRDYDGATADAKCADCALSRLDNGTFFDSMARGVVEIAREHEAEAVRNQGDYVRTGETIEPILTPGTAGPCP